MLAIDAQSQLPKSMEKYFVVHLILIAWRRVIGASYLIMRTRYCRKAALFFGFVALVEVSHIFDRGFDPLDALLKALPISA